MYSSNSLSGMATSPGYPDHNLNSRYRYPTSSSPQNNPKEKQSEFQSDRHSSFDSSRRSTNHTLVNQLINHSLINNPSEVSPTAPVASEPTNINEEAPPPSYFEAIHSQSYM